MGVKLNLRGRFIFLVERYKDDSVIDKDDILRGLFWEEEMMIIFF